MFSVKRITLTIVLVPLILAFGACGDDGDSPQSPIIHTPPSYGHPLFNTNCSYPTGSNTRNLVVADLNGNGYDDIAVVNSRPANMSRANSRFASARP